MAYEKWHSLEKVNKYYHRRYRSFDQRLIDRREKKIVYDIFLKYKINGKILDIPCGYGRFHPLLVRFGEVHAADNGKLIAKFQQDNIGLAKSTTICDAADMPFKDNSFDAVFSFRLIQHIHNRTERINIYKEFCRVSKNWVIISLYVNSAIHQTIKKINKKKAKITFLQNAEINDEFSEANLDIVSSQLVLPVLHGHKVLLTKLAR